jgi:hypothetical protein
LSLTLGVGECPKGEGVFQHMTLSDQEIERYARHIVLSEVGGPGQNKLKQASVLVIGAGGLGAPLLLYLGSGLWMRIRFRSPTCSAR